MPDRCVVTIDSEPSPGVSFGQRSMHTVDFYNVATTLIDDCVRDGRGVGGFATLELQNPIRNFFAPFGRSCKCTSFPQAQHGLPQSRADKSRPDDRFVPCLHIAKAPFPFLSIKVGTQTAPNNPGTVDAMVPLHISETLEHFRGGRDPYGLDLIVYEPDILFAQSRLVFAARQMRGRHDLQWTDFVYPLPAVRTTIYSIDEEEEGLDDGN